MLLLGMVHKISFGKITFVPGGTYINAPDFAASLAEMGLRSKVKVELQSNLLVCASSFVT